MKLLILESPGKKKKVQEYLGSDWRVEASVGHVRDLPENDMGVAAPDFTPQYVATVRGKEVLAKLAALTQNAESVYLATDQDREGEAIAWHLADALNLREYKRITYTEITEAAIKAALAAPRSIDMALVHAQEGRRVLDRFCGYMVSGPLSTVAGAKLSSGRVQSPAVRIVVEREREITGFKSTTHYGVELSFEQLENIQDGWKALWLSKPWLPDGQEYILDKALAEKVAALRTLDVLDCKESESRSAPPAPFTTSSLQQAASNALKFTPKQTMQLAQKLYEGGHITYHRTDSPNLSVEAVEAAREFCEAQGWPLVDKPRTWKSKDGAQEAHEAIRATHIEIEEAGDTPDEQALYRLIRLRVLAAQLADAVFAVRILQLGAELDGKQALFEARGKTLVSPGWKVLISSDAAMEDEEATEPDNAVPAMKPGTKATALAGNLLTKKTKPAPRYSEASLIRELEKRGIGRPSTYATIISKIIDSGYVKTDKRNLVPTQLGEMIVDNLRGHFAFIDYEFTKNMEQALDDIAEGKAQYHAVVSAAYSQIVEELSGFTKAKGTVCPECGELLRHIVNKEKGYNFFACDNEGCKAKFSCVDGKPGPKNEAPALTEFACEKCGKPIKHLKGKLRDGSGDYDFFACSDRSCGTTYDNIDGKPVARAPKAKNLTEFKCKKCGKPLEAKPKKSGGIWFGCSGWPKCETRYWALEDGTPDFDNKPKNKK